MRWLYGFHDSDKENNKPISPIKGSAEYYNNKGYGIFFTVNTFKSSIREESNLEKLDYWYVDMDSGTKTNQFKRIVDFGLVPSMVVETKNGHHVYWAIKDSPTIEEYKLTLQRLILFFDGDEAAKDVSRVLRMPDYYHMKNPHNKFLIECIFERNIKYTTKEMNSCLPEIEKQEIVYNQEKYIPKNDSFWDSASGLDSIHALQILSGTSEVNEEHFELTPRISGGFHIKVNGKQANCFVDRHGKIGPVAGPTIIQWLEYYGHNKSTVAEIIKKYFPETIPKTINFLK